MPTFYLDGQPIEFEKGETILAAARRYGREIPHYCYHPGLKVTAQCRMCLVDVVDAGNGNPIPKLQTSCSTPAAEGMKVDSQNEKVKAGQNTINEFLLVNHPLDCPICDQAGECDLQNFAFTYGTGHSEMEYEKRVYGWREVGSFLVLERNRCIHCSRCERFSRDVEGSHDFGMFLRTHELTFDTYEDEQIQHKFQGNLADICPVGAIMNRDWRFKKRAWKLKKTPSVCTSCSTGCNVTVEQEGGRIYRYKPRENQAVNRWWMCDEGRVGFHHLNDHTKRNVEPQARVQGKLRDVSWDAVYGAVAQRLAELKATGPGGGAGGHRCHQRGAVPVQATAG
jgi:NADH-quinone oxidoreductase subunit G